MGYVYGLRGKDDSQYFYIGTTKFSPEKRLKQHLYSVSTDANNNKHFVNKVRKIGMSNIVVDVIETCANSERFEREEFWIKKYLSDGIKLTNLVHNGIDPKTLRGIASKYSLANNWQWALNWYHDYKQGWSIVPDDDPYAKQLRLAQIRLADIVESVLALPESEQHDMIQQYDDGVVMTQ